MAANNLSSDSKLSDVGDTDIVILVIGQTGAGMSTFINHVLSATKDERRVAVGTGMDPCTTKLECIAIGDQATNCETYRHIQGRRVVLIDTPGFDYKTNHGVSVFVKDIANLIKQLSQRKLLGGVLYLHDISNSRFTTSARIDLNHLSGFCGDTLLKGMTFVTTKWGQESAEALEKREKELKNDHWKTAMGRGADVIRLEVDKEEESALGAVKALLKLLDEREGNGPVPEAPDTPLASHVTRETDIIIPVMGSNGAGKSSFINYLLNGTHTRKWVKVGDGLSPCTTQPKEVVLEGFPAVPPHCRVVLVDTPGLDISYYEDIATLGSIAEWLAKSYRQRNMVIGGVIYLTDITQDRIGQGSAERHLRIFANFCKGASLDKVVLVTSKWRRAFGRDLERKERILRENHWHAIIKYGAQVMSLNAPDERDSASAIVKFILQNVDYDAGGLQRTPNLDVSISRRVQSWLRMILGY